MYVELLELAVEHMPIFVANLRCFIRKYGALENWVVVLCWNEMWVETVSANPVPKYSKQTPKSPSKQSRPFQTRNVFPTQ
jgi:hypothetical protein